MYPDLSKPIDKNCEKLVEEIESQSGGKIIVLAARQFRYQIKEFCLKIGITEPRKYNILEELVLKAGIELNPPPNLDELAQIFGLDIIFIKSTVQNLQSLCILENNSNDLIKLTEKGKEFYQKGKVPQLEKEEEIYLIDDLFERDLIVSDEEKNIRLIENIPYLKDFINIEIFNYHDLPKNLEELRGLIESSKLGFHIPEEGKIVSSYEIISEKEDIDENVTVLLLFDILTNNLKFTIKKGVMILEEASHKFNDLLDKQKISLEKLLDISEDFINREKEILWNQRNEEVENRIKQIENQYLNVVEQKTETIEGIRLIRDREIRKVFLNTIKSAKEEIIIYSPWISESVIDNQFIDILQKLVNKGVSIIIGYGISRNESDEDRPISPQIKTRLENIKTPNGLTGIQLHWLGNSHAKEVIVDRTVHLCGSHNFLSYRGDILPRGETLYEVKLVEPVKEAYKFLSERFIKKAEYLWKEGLKNQDISLQEKAVYLWCTLNQEDIVIKNINEHQLEELWSLVDQIRENKLK